MKKQLLEGQVVKISAGEAKVLVHVVGEVIALERLGHTILGKTEYIIGRYPVVEESGLVIWERGNYFYSKDSLERKLVELGI